MAAVKKARVDVFTECLATPNPIDFTALDFRGDTILHVIAEHTQLLSEEAVAMIRAVCDRIQRHPADTVDFSLKNRNGEDFLGVVARNQLLSGVWSFLQEMPYYADATEPFTVREVWEWDLQALERDEQACFLPASTLRVSAPTAKLWKLCGMSDVSRYVERIDQWVKEGADVMWRTKKGVIARGQSILYRIIGHSSTPEPFLLCLQTPRRIDFSHRYYGNTILHRIAERGAVVGLPLLRAVVRRTSLSTMDKNRVITATTATTGGGGEGERKKKRVVVDLIDWGVKNFEHRDCLAVAATKRWAGEWWLVVKEAGVLFYAAHGMVPKGVARPTATAGVAGGASSVLLLTPRSSQIEIPYMYLDDWKKIPYEDRKYFKVQSLR